jgi:predicted PurR-regulated permease PerM
VRARRDQLLRAPDLDAKPGQANLKLPKAPDTGLIPGWCTDTTPDPRLDTGLVDTQTDRDAQRTPSAEAETVSPANDEVDRPGQGDGRDDRPMPRWVPKAIALWYGAAFVALAIFLVIRELQDLILWFLFALFLSFAIEPAVNALAHRGWRRWAAAALIVFGALVALVLIVALMVPVVVAQAEELVDRAPQLLEQVNVYAERWFGTRLSGDDALRFFEDAKADLASIAARVAQGGGIVAGLLLQVLTIGLFTYYLVADGPKFRRTVCSFLPQRVQREVLSTWEIAIDRTGGYLYSRLLLAGISAAVTFLALLVLHIPYPLPLALWVGFVSQFIPVIGTYLGAAIPLLVALLENPRSALFLLIFFVVYQQIENYVLAPRITAHTMELHPAVAFAAALAGVWIGGVPGAFIALPAVAILQATVTTYARRHEIVETELTLDQDGGDSGRTEGRRRSSASGEERSRSVAGAGPDG